MVSNNPTIKSQKGAVRIASIFERLFFIMMLINNLFEIGEIVYLVTDKEQVRRVVTQIKVCPDDSILRLAEQKMLNIK